MYLLIATLFVTKYHSYRMDLDNKIKQIFNYFVFVSSKSLVENTPIYTARSWLDNRDIRKTDGRITEVQLY